MNTVFFLLSTSCDKEKQDVGSYLSSLELVLRANPDKINNLYNISNVDLP